jgi:hypothetical protein
MPAPGIEPKVIEVKQSTSTPPVDTVHTIGVIKNGVHYQIKLVGETHHQASNQVEGFIRFIGFYNTSEEAVTAATAKATEFAGAILNTTVEIP